MTLEPGCYLDLSERDYHQIKARDLLSNSFIKTMVAKSPAHALAGERTHSDSAPMMLGRATHSLVLTPECFARDYVLWDGTKRGKVWEAFRDEHEGSQILNRTEWTTAHQIREAISWHKRAAGLFVGGQAEVTIVAEVNGIRVKIRIDYLIEHDDRIVIVDLKTTGRSAHPSKFVQSAWDLGYHLQAGLYTCIASLEFNKPCSFVIVAAETVNPSPAGVVVYDFPPDLINWAESKMVAAIDTFSDHRAADHWPGISDEVLTMGVPRYMQRDIFGTDD